MIKPEKHSALTNPDAPADAAANDISAFWLSPKSGEAEEYDEAVKWACRTESLSQVEKLMGLVERVEHRRKGKDGHRIYIHMGWGLRGLRPAHYAKRDAGTYIIETSALWCRQSRALVSVEV